jgi:Xaa-Pro aminopeptidase
MTVTDRLTQVQAALELAGLDALLVAAPPNVAYVSGFRAEPHERLIALVVPRDGRPRLVCPSLEEGAARAAVAGRVDLRVWRDEDGPADALAHALGGVGARVGIEKAYLSVANAELAASAAPAATFTGCDGVLAELRAVKSEDEIAAIRRAADIVDRVVVHLAAAATPGTTEAELAAACAQRLRAEGAEAPAFEPLILTGPRSALPHGHPGATALAEGDLLIVDIGATVDGYSADITRTFVVGSEPDDRQRAVFEIVLAAKGAGVDAARAGAAARGVDAAARGVIEEAGYGPNFVHRTGHGLGLEVHEPPYLTATNDEPLRAGMVVTVEPGIYVEGWGGVRIEDDVVIREEAAEVLTHAPIALSPGEAPE